MAEHRGGRRRAAEAAPYMVALVCALAFLLSGARHLDRVPQVYEDEPWQASTAYLLLQHGTFGSDLFAGFHNMQARYYGFLPAHPLLLALDFRIFGVGLVQARLETVGLGLLILLLTFGIGRRLFGAWVGALALVVLVFARWSGLTYIQLTGIPLVDFSRIARYDPLAAALGLLALLAYLHVRTSATRLGYVAVGLLAGLSGLAHLYGLFWVIVLVALVCWDRARLAPAGWIVLGALLPWLPYAAYVAADLPDWRGQTAGYANRFELLNPAWYLDNLAQEYHRYGPGLGPPGLGMLLRVGFWSLLVALPGSLAALTWRALRCGDAAARAIVVPAILLPLLFAALIHLKLVNYTLLELPLEALAVAWGTVVIWRRPGRWPRLLLAALVLAVCTEGTLQLLRLEAQAAITTPYAVFAQRVRQYVPDGAHVLGLHTYWFGFEDLDYRSFLVPLLLADEGMPLDQALDTTAADTLLLDDRLRAYFAPSGDASAQDRQRFESWLQRHDATRVGAVNDPTYGLLEVYHLQP